MFVTRRRIGTPRVTKPGKPKEEIRQHNEGHTISSHCALPPIVREALREYPDPTTISGMVNGASKVKSESGSAPADVLILDLPSDDCFVSFAGDSRGIFSCSKSGTIQYWPIFRKSTTFNMELPLDSNVTVTSLTCKERYCWIGTSDGKIAHFCIKRDNNATLEFLRFTSKSKGVMGRMFSWGWSAQPSIPILKLSATPISETSFYLLALTSQAIEIWESSDNEDRLHVEIPLKAALETEFNAPVTFLDCKLKKKTIFVFVSVAIRGQKNASLFLVPITSAFTPEKQVRTRKPFQFKLPEKYIPKGNSTDSHLYIAPSGGAIALLPGLIIATEVPIDKEPLLVQQKPVGGGSFGGNLLLVITKGDLLAVDITCVIKNESVRTKALPDVFRERFEAFLLENRVEQFARTEDKRQFSADVLRLSESILDDKHSDDAYSSRLLHQRLEEKNEKHRQFIEFLRLSGSFDDLSVQVKYSLLVHMEKIEGAMSLYENLQKMEKLTKLIPDAMQNCIRLREQEGTSSLRKSEGYTLQDIFFSEVTKVDQLLECINMDAFLEADGIRAGSFIYESNVVFVSILSIPWEKRNHFCGKLGVDGTEYTNSLWNFSPLIRNRVIHQNSKYTGPFITRLINSGPHPSLNTLVEQLLKLDEFVLDTYQFELDQNTFLTKEQRTKTKEEFETAKHILILKGPLLPDYKELATNLAGRFMDFPTITKICDTEEYPQNILELNSYLVKYRDTKFPSFVFKYFQENGKYDQLLCDRLDVVDEEGGKDALSTFLIPHPRYSWLHAIRMEEFSSASRALLQDAYAETENVTRRSTLLGLSKLANLASQDSEDLTIDNARYLNDYQRFTKPEEQVPVDATFFISRLIEESDFIGAIRLFSHTTLLREEEKNEELSLVMWGAALSSVDWPGISAAWGDESNQFGDQAVKMQIEDSHFYKLCRSPESNGCWNPNFLGHVMGTYFTMVRKEQEAAGGDVESLAAAMKLLERLLGILLEFCTSPPN